MFPAIAEVSHNEAKFDCNFSVFAKFEDVCIIFKYQEEKFSGNF